MTDHDSHPTPMRRRLAVVSEAPAGGEIDPVCGMTVDPAAGKPSSVHGGRTYWFCCAGCQAKFEADPGKYLAGHRESMTEAEVFQLQLKRSGLTSEADYVRIITQKTASFMSACTTLG